MSIASEPWTDSQKKEIGRVCERNFIDAFTKYPVNFPHGVYRIVPATRQEDMDGTDAWAESEFGRIPIQIKGSYDGIARHKQQHPDSDAIVIVVHCTDTVRQIQTKAYSLLERAVESKRRTSRKRRTARW